MLIGVLAASLFSGAQLSAQQTVAASVKDEIVEMSPFEVISDPDSAYSETNINSITGLNTPLKDVPISAMIFNQQLYDDLAVVSPIDMLRDYAVGVGPPLRGPADATEGDLAGDNYGPNNFRIRGLQAGIPRVDGTLEAGTATIDQFYLDRTEVIRGPQSLLYGSAAASGLINVVSKQADFKRNFRKVVLRFDSEGSARGELDLNQVLFKNRLALRVALMREDRKYWRDFLGEDGRGWHAQVAYRPTDWMTIRVLGQQIRYISTQGVGGMTLIDPTDPTRNNRTLALLLAQGNTAGIFNDKLSWENIDSLAMGDFKTRGRHINSYLATVDLHPRTWVNARLSFGDTDWNDRNDTIRNGQNLRPPWHSSNPTGEWATGGRPGDSSGSPEPGFGEGSRVARGIVTMTFDALKNRWHTKNTLAIGAERKERTGDFVAGEFYLVDANGDFVVNPNQVTNTNAGRTQPPIVFWGLESNPRGIFTPGMTEWVGPDGRVYKPAARRQAYAVPPTPTNPLGIINPGGGRDKTLFVEKSAFASWSSQLFDNRLSTLAGVRYNEYVARSLTDNKSEGDDATSWNAGAVYHLTPSLGIYGGYSQSWSPNSQVGGLYPTGNPIPTQVGIGYEVGLKFDVAPWKMSGSLAAYKVENTNEMARLGEVHGIIDPNGINGRSVDDISNPPYLREREVHGIELTLTANPTEKLRIYGSYSFSGAKGSSTVTFPMLYNDEFRTNSAGGVLFDDGSPALVRSNPTDPSSALVQLTTTMMKDPSSPYFVNLDPNSGRFRNMNAGSLQELGLVDAEGRTIGTGRVGLPISSHQLGFVSPVGADFVVEKPGQKTGQYPEHSVSVTASYTLTHGFLNGVSIGGNASYRWKRLAYYYFRTGGAEATQLMYPNQFQANLMLGKSFKISNKVMFRTQFNVQNLFDSQETIMLPRIATGEIFHARLMNNPRLFIWTNTFQF